MRAAFVVACLVVGCTPEPKTVRAAAHASDVVPDAGGGGNDGGGDRGGGGDSGNPIDIDRLVPASAASGAGAVFTGEPGGRVAPPSPHAHISIRDGGGSSILDEGSLRALQASLVSCAKPIPHHPFFKQKVTLTLLADAGGIRSAVAIGGDSTRETLDCVENRAREARLPAEPSGKLVLDVELSHPGRE
jgi:hypothetical protein